MCGSLLAAVDDDIFWLDPFLQHPLFRMFAPPSKQPWRLNFKVAYPLLVVVQQTETVLIHYLLVGFFHSLHQTFQHTQNKCNCLSILKERRIQWDWTQQHLGLKKKSLNDLFLLLAHIFSGLHFCFVHGVNLSKVTFVEIYNHQPLLIRHFLGRQEKSWTYNAWDIPAISI